jgi:ectoine hydroxylase-related dioxygenase (phytanoyl-CoA dioxygenase family)
MVAIKKSADLRAQYAEDGFVFSPPIVPSELIERVVPRMDAVLEGRYETGMKPHAVRFGPNDPPEKLRRIDQAHLCDSLIRRVVTYPEMGEWIAGLLDARWIQVWATQLLVKPAGGKEAGSVGWHQDLAYWPYWQGEVFTVWIAVSNVTEKSGPLRYVRGSHKWGLLQGTDSMRCDIALQQQDIALQSHGAWEETPVVLPPGAFSVQHGLLLHGSGPNYSDEPRRSLLVHMRTERSRPTADNYYTEHLDNPLYAPVIYKA